MEQIHATTIIKNFNTADEVIRFQLTPSIFKDLYTDHLQALLL